LLLRKQEEVSRQEEGNAKKWKLRQKMSEIAQIIIKGRGIAGSLPGPEALGMQAGKGERTKGGKSIPSS